MTRRISFVYKDKKYVLEYTRSSIKEMERRGFVIEEVLKKPLSMLPDMFAGAFIANHRFIRRKEIDEIYEQFDNKDELVNALAEMYNLVIEEFIEELEKKGNGLKWERS